MRQAFVVLMGLLLVGSPAWVDAQTMVPAQSEAAPAPNLDTPAVTTAGAGFEAVQAGVPMGREIDGRIRSLDPLTNTLRLEDGTALVVPPSVAIALGNLLLGEEVIATYREGQDGTKIATWVQPHWSAKS